MWDCKGGENDIYLLEYFIYVGIFHIFRICSLFSGIGYFNGRAREMGL